MDINFRRLDPGFTRLAGFFLVFVCTALNAGESQPAPKPIQEGPASQVFKPVPKAEAGEPKKRKSEAIQDNSFLVEEAYNQEAGVVQHIFNFVFENDKKPGRDDRAYSIAFTQEWPLLTQDHQISYTLPYTTVDTEGQRDNGIEDVALNYRWQALYDTDSTPAFAPRISFLFPTGDDDEDRGTGHVSYEVNLPVSKVLDESWTIHFNARATVEPGQHVRLENGRRTSSKTLSHFNLGFSTIYAVTENFNLMLEWVGGWNQEFRNDGNLRRRFSAIVNPGFRAAVNLPKVKDMQIVTGLAFPIGLTHTAPDFGVFVYLSVEHNF